MVWGKQTYLSFSRELKIVNRNNRIVIYSWSFNFTPYILICTHENIFKVKKYTIYNIHKRIDRNVAKLYLLTRK